jgi:hypothetical protein
VWGGRDIKGFGSTAKKIVADRDCVAVLYDGYFDAQFVFNMRAMDAERRIYVFRASKIIFTTKQFAKWGYKELVRDESAFEEILRRYSVKYVIQEERDILNTPANRELRKWVNEKNFLLASIDKLDFIGFGNSEDLLVYKYRKYVKKPIGLIEIEIPTIGKKITVD